MLYRLIILMIFCLISSSCSGRYERAIVDSCVIAPVKEPDLIGGRLIVVDAGHGGKDPGAAGQEYEEKRLTLATAKQITKCLEQLGYRTLMTRSGDTFVSLSDRARKANELKADFFVSIHYNFSANNDAEGIEVYYYGENKKGDGKKVMGKRILESKQAATSVLQRIVKHTNAHSRGVKEGNFAVIRETKMAAILVEGGFLSHVEERRRIKDPQYMQYLAWGIARGIDTYFENQKKR